MEITVCYGLTISHFAYVTPTLPLCLSTFGAYLTCSQDTTDASRIEDASQLTDNDILAYIYAIDPDTQTHITRGAFHAMMAKADEVGLVNISLDLYRYI